MYSTLTYPEKRPLEIDWDGLVGGFVWGVFLFVLEHMLELLIEALFELL